MSDSTDPDLPTRLLHELARESLIERRRARRWSIFFRTVTLLLVAGIAFALLRDSGALGSGSRPGKNDDGHTALIRIEGVIASDLPASIDPINRALDRAFDDKNTRGVVLQINSPGGSPVQSGLIYDAIVEQRARHPEVPVHAVLGDIAASGGYYLAAAAENIYANSATIVGSIGVRLDSFGAVDAMQRLGIERRLLTAGEHKGLLDPFEPIDEVAIARLQSMLENVHLQFIDAVKRGRGARLNNDPKLFSGLVWSGEEALDNGLIDALASSREVAKDVIGAAYIVDYTELGDPLTRLRRELGVSLSRLVKSTFRSLFEGDHGDYSY